MAFYGVLYALLTGTFGGTALCTDGAWFASRNLRDAGTVIYHSFDGHVGSATI